MTCVNVMLDADAVINNSSEKVGGSNAYPDPAPEKWVSPDPEKHTGSTPPLPLVLSLQRVLALLHVRLSPGLNGVVGLMSHVRQLGRVVTLLLSALLTLCTPPLIILLHKHDVIQKPEVHNVLLEVAGYATQHSDAKTARQRATLAKGDVASRAGSANERAAGSCRCHLGL